MREDAGPVTPATDRPRRFAVSTLAAPLLSVLAAELRSAPACVYSEKKRLEKLNYMHGNPVKCGLVASPEQWPWSSFRFYSLNDSSVLSMDRLA